MSSGLKFLRDMGKIGVQASFTYFMHLWWGFFFFAYVRTKIWTLAVCCLSYIVSYFWVSSVY